MGDPLPPQSHFPAGKPERTRVCTCLELSLPWAGRPWASAPPSVNGPQPAMPGQPHPQHGPATPPFLLSMLLNMGRGGGLTETVSPVVSPYCKRPLPLSMAWGGGNPPRPLKAQKRPPAVSPQPGKGGNGGRREGCECLRPGRWVPPGARWGAQVTAWHSMQPLLQCWQRGAQTEGLGAAGPAPPPGTRQHPSPRPAPGGVGGSALETAPGRAAARARSPRPPYPPHSLAFPGRGLCSSLCAVPTSSAFTACTSSCSFPMARPGPQRRG